MTQEELDRGVSSGDAKCLHEASRRTMDAAVSSGDISVERFDTAFGQSLAAAELASINTLGGSWNIEIRSLLDCWRQSVRQMPGSIYSRDKNFAKRVKKQMNIDLRYGEAVKNYIFEKGYDKKYGARPLRRAIQNEIEDKMAEELLAGNIKAGQTVRVSVLKSGVKFKVI